MKKLSLAVAASLFAVVGASAHAADLAAGQAAFQKYTCATCHGADAKTSTLPNYPILAGQHADYLAHALRTYKRGAAGAPATANVRKDAVMGAMVQQLNETDIKNISAWLASLPSPLSVAK
ncbi:MAG TPA: c-type cytochrome [Pusillimonas sp.]|uniref:c-type cytochrome n=1 Tax=Pusillimonas sp. TaxID=3040095 RepID=UPI002B680DC6|nr:c-type cytochrome [Pusillimonas sp.]HUH87801.1 c-type cytochrome [Pusillimonas sp.]